MAKSKSIKSAGKPRRVLARKSDNRKSWLPKELAGTKGIYVSHIDRDNPIILCVEGEAGPEMRLPSAEQITAYLLRRPYDIEQFSAARLPELLPKHDGELFALFARRRELAREFYDTKTHQHRAGYEQASAECLQKICDTPAVTDAGNGFKLQLLMDATWPHGDALLPHQQRQLVWSAMRWLLAPAFDRKPMTRRALDTVEMAEALAGYRQCGTAEQIAKLEAEEAQATGERAA